MPEAVQSDTARPSQTGSTSTPWVRAHHNRQHVCRS